jgi:hypothetical protein
MAYTLKYNSISAHAQYAEGYNQIGCLHHSIYLYGLRLSFVRTKKQIKTETLNPVNAYSSTLFVV